MNTVLIVDDHADNRYYLETLLSASGYTPVSATQGQEALELARRTPPDAVVSDLLMPVMDGYTLLRQWKADPVLCSVPFIVYTATYTASEDEQLALNLGADRFLVKPLEPEKFLAALREVADAHRSTQRSPAPLEESDLFEQYNRTLVRKLEEKTLALEQANRQLHEDIVQRETMAEQLRRAEERFRLLARATNDAIWDWNIVTNERWWGSGFENLFGYGQSPALPNDESWATLVHPDDRDAVTRQLDAALAGQDDSWSATYRLRRANGQWAHVEDRGFILRDRLDAPVRMIGGICDVSERLAMEERMRRSQRLEAVGELTGGVAHDFNNLLTVVLGNAETLMEQLEDNPRLAELADIIASAAERGSDMTRRLLAFARRQPLTPRSVALAGLLDDMLPLLRQAMGKSIAITLTSGDPPLPAVLIDPTQLESAVLNLCVNARDAMPAGGQLTLSLQELTLQEAMLAGDTEVPAGHYLRLSVSDTGIGIEPADRQRVFEPFFSTKAEGKGSGMGLAMVYGFIHQSGGHITLESAPGEGATFHLYLPVATGARLSVTRDPARDKAEQDLPAAHGESVLLVEDDPLVRPFASTLLQSLGYSVIEVADADSAIAILEGDSPIDLLFTDVMMQGRSGHELAARASQLRPGLPIVLTSGYTSPERLADDDTSLTNRYPLLVKPYHRRTLARALRDALD